ncbi:unnamed protein product [Pocillopora meandrina]|uniref:Dolichyl-diphosphooligosaccharide--protein glycosyltransferase subunit DAD1 n=1 Tax=Pocillopora meandrina TaxID=46732 RepID=A0AAU9VY62_9CNID|nr:unnamed protein product [Pocillopora meandrina]
MDTFSNIKNILVKFYDEYNQTTPKKLKIVDAYLFYIMLTGIIQFVYCCLVGTFPFNSFLSGFISCVGSFVLGGKKIYRANADVHSFFVLPYNKSLNDWSPMKQFLLCNGVILFVTVCLRVQSNPANYSDFKGISPERAFADFIFASIILHLVVMNFIG